MCTLPRLSVVRRRKSAVAKDLRWAVTASVILHAVLIYFLKAPAPVQRLPSLTSLNLSLHSATAVPPASRPTARSAQSVAPRPAKTPAPSRAEGVTPRAVERPSPPAAVDSTAVPTVRHPMVERPSPPEAVGNSGRTSTPSIDVEAIRAQVRNLDLGKEPAKGGRAQQEPAVAPALAKALAGPSQVQEVARADGTRVIRYSGNRCLHIPAHVPIWRESQVVPTEWVATNCDG